MDLGRGRTSPFSKAGCLSEVVENGNKQVIIFYIWISAFAGMTEEGDS